MSSQGTALRSHAASLSRESVRDHLGADMYWPDCVFDPVVRKANKEAGGIAELQDGVPSAKQS